jgi:hypothetical protein
LCAAAAVKLVLLFSHLLDALLKVVAVQHRTHDLRTVLAIAADLALAGVVVE